MVVVNFNVQGVTQVSRNLRVLAKDITNLGEFYGDALDIITARSDSIFAVAGANVQRAGVWPPLAASTIKAREKRWGYYKRSPSRPGVLRWTGNLQENKDRHVSDRGGRLTYRAPYAIYHQDGGGHLPRRVVVDLSDETGMQIVKSLQAKINRDIGVFGRQV